MEQQEVIGCNEGVIEIQCQVCKVQAIIEIVHILFGNRLDKIEDGQGCVDYFKPFVGRLFKAIESFVKIIYYTLSRTKTR